jgi:cell division protein FtsN
LQAGAFQNAPDADNLKARLALMGLEATIQTTTLPDRGTWHRVRVGPYSSVEELARTRDTLKQNGVETTLVKVRTGAAR